MTYLACVGLPFVLQLVFTYIMVQAGTGGGSFVGLGAMLFALVGIPVTAIVNFVLVRTRSAAEESAVFFKSMLIALVLPIAQFALLIGVSLLRL